MPIAIPRSGVSLQSVRAWFGERLNTFRLSRVPRRDVDFSNLILLEKIDLRRVLDPSSFVEEWQSVERKVVEGNLGASANRGDQRALYQFVRHFQPVDVLEIGTRFGVSALVIAAAMHRNSVEAGRKVGTLKTLDVRDVDDPARPWAQSGQPLSPRQLVAEAGYANVVDFITQDSSTFLASTTLQFDFVFLDGSTAAAGVYRDLQNLPNVIREGAVVLVHVYFPEGRPLWPGQGPINGPWHALSRLQAEVTNVVAQPLGELPWPTKMETNRTSLALIGRRL